MGQKLDAALADLDETARHASTLGRELAQERLQHDQTKADRDRARQDLEKLQAQFTEMARQREYWRGATKDARAKRDELHGDKNDLLNKLKRAELKNDSLQKRLLAKSDTQRQHTAAVVTFDDWVKSATRFEIPSTEYQNLMAKAYAVETLMADLDHARAENDRLTAESAKMFATVKELRDDLMRSTKINSRLRDDLVYLNETARHASTLDRELAQERLQHDQTNADLAKLQEQLLASDNAQHQHAAGVCVPRAEYEELRQTSNGWADAYHRSVDNAQKVRIKKARAERKHAASKRKHKGAEARAHKLTKELNTVLHTLEIERYNLRETAVNRDRYRERLAKAEREATETRANGRKRETYVVSTFGRPDRFETAETGTVADLRLGDRGRLATIETRDGRTYKGYIGDIAYGVDPTNKDAGIIVGIGLNTETGTPAGGVIVGPEDKLIIHTTTADAERKQAEQALADYVNGPWI